MHLRLHRRLGAFVFLTTLILACAADARTIKIATISPDGSSWMRIMREGAKEIGEQTEGRVKFKFYPGGVMGNETAVLRKIRVGQLQGAALTGSSLTQYYSDVWLYGLPLVFHSYDEVDYVRKRLDPVLIRGLREQGWEVLGFGEGGFAYPMSVVPTPSVADARAQKVWVPEGDPVAALTMQAFGIKPIPLALSDVLTALQTGLVTGVSTSPVGAIAFQWHTKLRYITDLPVVYTFGALVVDTRTFDKLSAADQQAVRSVMAKAFDQINAINRRDDHLAMEALLNQGLKLVHPNAAQVAEWQRLADEAIQAMIDRKAVSKDLYERMVGYLNEYRNGS